MEKIINEIKSNNNVIIYGAGAYANMFYTYLQLENLENQVSCFAVSKLDGNMKKIADKRVKEYSSLEKGRIMTVIIAMDEKIGMDVYEQISQDETKAVILLSQYELQKIAQKIYDYFNEIPINREKVFVECYLGLGFKCNCKYFIQELFKRKPNVQIVWSLNNVIENDLPKGIKVVQRFSYEYFCELYTSGIWIGNAGYSPYLIKRKQQYYVEFWHGSGPFKRAGADVLVNKRKLIEEGYNRADLFISNTGDNTDMFRDSLLYHGEIYECGSPRNDIFFNKAINREDICREIGIDCNKKIVLYAPTFRECGERSFKFYDLEIKSVLNILEQRFDSEFVLMYRFHHHLYKYDRCKNYYPEALDVTLYPDMQELLFVSDVLITDYSSSMWDFSLQDRPIFLYHNDKEEYENDRGFYCPPSQWPYPQAHSNEEMIEIIRNFDEEKYLKDLHAFIHKYKSFDDGHASERVVERIMDVIEHPEKYDK